MRLRFGECILDTDSRELWRGEEPVHLVPKAFRLLEVLLDARPRVLSKSDLLGLVWPEAFVSEANLSSLIADLRDALGDEARDPRFLRTVHGFGYAFCGEAFALPPRKVESPGGERVHRLIWRAREIALRQGENLLGRDAETAVWIEDPSVSRRHARIVVAEGTAVLEDLGSKNGTWVRGARIRARAELKDGDVFRVGSVELVYRVFSAPGSTETWIPRSDRRPD
jgi:DNA-binding winged helix-turn-helix (wHTH) protein